MGRRAQVRYYKSKGAYFTEYGGRRHRLATGPDDGPTGPTYLEALAAYTRILTGSIKPDASDDRLIACLERWLDHVQKHKSAGYYRVSKGYLTRGVKRWGSLLVSQLRLHHVSEWLESEKDWSGTTRRIAYDRLVASLNWNVSEGYITSHPLKGRKPPSAACGSKARGAEYVLDDGLCELLLATAQGRFRDYLTALHRTGARPSEIGLAEDYHYRPSIGAFVFEADARKGYIHKTAGKKKHGDRNRTVYLPPDVVTLVERNLKVHPKGFIFPAERATNFGKDVRRLAFTKLRAKPAISGYLAAHNINKAHVILYSFRHTFITNALKKGVSIKVLADLMGTSVKMIETNYGHASADTDFMRKVFLTLV